MTIHCTSSSLRGYVGGIFPPAVFRHLVMGEEKLIESFQVWVSSGG